MSIFSKIFGDVSSKFISETRSLVSQINALEGEIAKLPDADFPQKTREFKDRLNKGETLDALLPEAFALVRETAKRNLGERHYDVQLVGGIALHRGKIAEMKTGEGKTLVATLPLYLNALAGRGTHLVTVNDYLARRDAVLMGQIFNFLGLSVGVINGGNVSYLYNPKHSEADAERDKVGEFKIVYEYLEPVERRAAYQADITYGTNHEFGFDYLRDNLAVSLEGVTQRGHHFAIVDEVDSILIDEARTPLIISSQAGDSEDFYIKILGVPGLGRNNQRRARLVYQNRVHFVHDGEVMTSLRHAFQRYGQIVPQIIKAKFMISAVSDIRLISGASLRGLQILVNNFEFADLVPLRICFAMFGIIQIRHIATVNHSDR